jgi:hypothetical protein
LAYLRIIGRIVEKFNSTWVLLSLKVAYPPPPPRLVPSLSPLLSPYFVHFLPPTDLPGKG